METFPTIGVSSGRQVRLIASASTIIQALSGITNYLGATWIDDSAGSNVSATDITTIKGLSSGSTKLNNAFLENLTICVTAYNKKQEFNGGIIKVNKMKCNYLTNKTTFDKYSLIKELNKL